MQQRQSPRRAITILLVDDDADARALVRDAIESHQPACRIMEAGNGAEALAILRRDGRHADAPRPHLILLDIEMPYLDGLGLLREIKCDPDLLDIPTVVLTGVDQEETIQQAASLGANSYLHKSLSPEAMLRTIDLSMHYWLNIHCHPLAEGAQR